MRRAIYEGVMDRKTASRIEHRKDIASVATRIQRSVDMSPPLMGLLVVNIEGGS